MKEYLKIPIWRPGQYSNLISETTELHGETIMFNKKLFVEKMQGNRISEHGVAFDLHNLYKHVPGKEKTKAMK